MPLEMQIGTNMAVHLQHLLGQAIVSGAYDDKPFPTEVDLATELGASRTVVREAIKMLTAKGLISARQRGARVLPMSAWDLLDPDVTHWLAARPFSLDVYREFTHMRLAVEPVAAALAAQRPDRTIIAEIGSQLDNIRSAPAATEARLQATIDFHTAILVASGNAFFHRLQGLIHTTLHMAAPIAGVSDNTDLSMREEIYEAIVNRDSTNAEATMRALLLKSRQSLEEIGSAGP